MYTLGLGYYRAWVNGAPSDDHVLGGFTTFQQRVTYDVADVTSSLHAGCNAISLLLGDGWWAQSSIGAGAPQLLMLLSVRDINGNVSYYASTAASGGGGLAFVTAPGPVTYADIYFGERYDARLVQAGWQGCYFQPATPWAAAVAAPAPTPDTYGSAISAVTVPIRIDRDYSVVVISQPGPGEARVRGGSARLHSPRSRARVSARASAGQYVYDFGQNQAGLVTLRVACDAGERAVVPAACAVVPSAATEFLRCPCARRHDHHGADGRDSVPQRLRAQPLRAGRDDAGVVHVRGHRRAGDVPDAVQLLRLPVCAGKRRAA